MNWKKNVFWALPLIYVGVIWQASNMGHITPFWFHILISWQALLIYLGTWRLTTGTRVIPAIVAILVGIFFLLPEFGVTTEIHWPTTLILIGVLLLFKPLWTKKLNKRSSIHPAREGVSNYVCTDGYVESNNTFGSIQQIVLDPVFKGARIRNKFGGTVLDLRRTSLEAPETFIDIDCSFGGIEIYMPSHWNVQTKVNTIVGGHDNKRYNNNVDIDHEHVLIIRGTITFGGLELKS